jgi:hypothetical protein
MGLHLDHSTEQELDHFCPLFAHPKVIPSKATVLISKAQSEPQNKTLLDTSKPLMGHNAEAQNRFVISL